MFFRNGVSAVRRRPGFADGAFLVAACIAAFSAGAARVDAREIHGFAEAAFGPKIGGEGKTRHAGFNFLESRLQLKTLWRPARENKWRAELFSKSDLAGDRNASSVQMRIREAHVLFSPAEWLDVKIGRQILTWGTGDLLFVNDLFPKDFVSFFIGRDDEYLKAPSDAARFSAFGPGASLDVVFVPFFAPDAPLRGERLSFFDPTLGRIAGSDARRVLIEPAARLDHTEAAARLARSYGSAECALYAFRGFFKQPRGFVSSGGRELFYPRLAVWGASIRGPVARLGGIGWFEAGWYDSIDDRRGTDRLVENSAMKYLAGYERDFPNDARVGIQYYVERMRNFGAFQRSAAPGNPPRAERRRVLTLRLTRLFRFQTVEASLFAFYSPTDRDAHLRPCLSWKMSDEWTLVVGADVFTGRRAHTEFGQLDGNDNLYFRMRYSF